MITQKQFKEHFQNLLNLKAVYIWGGNGEIISKELVDKLFSWYGSKSYNREYYDGKLKEGERRIGADCSGAFFALSGSDTTVKGYYAGCLVKGKIGNIPKNVACIVFNANLNHMGAYMGDGTTIEMKSSKDNVHEEKLDASRWAYYGIPAWMDTTGVFIHNGWDYSLVFNPTYYSDRYPDLKNAFGTDAEALFNHFVKHGMKECRQACENFNVGYYKHEYKDLQKAFGENIPAYYKHYVQYGNREGRKTVQTYRVQSGPFLAKKDAEILVNEIKKLGYENVLLIE